MFWGFLRKTYNKHISMGNKGRLFILSLIIIPNLFGQVQFEHSKDYFKYRITPVVNQKGN